MRTKWVLPYPKDPEKNPLSYLIEYIHLDVCVFHKLMQMEAYLWPLRDNTGNGRGVFLLLVEPDTQIECLYY